MFSGTAIPVLAAAAIVDWIRHGFLRTLLLLLPAAVSYLLWFALIAREHRAASEGIANVGGALLYAGGMYGGGLGRALPWIGLGLIPAVALVVWFAVTVRRRMQSVAAPAYAMAIGSLLFVALTSWSRSSLGLSASAAQRYAYVTVVLTLPAFGIMLSRVLARSKLWSVTVATLLVVLIGYNVVLLAVDAGVQAQREAGSGEQVADPVDPRPRARASARCRSAFRPGRSHLGARPARLRLVEALPRGRTSSVVAVETGQPRPRRSGSGSDHPRRHVTS